MTQGVILSVGPTHPHHEPYATKCREAARGRPIEIMSKVPEELLPGLYHRARVHAMPSFFETTGLASLEAALCGAAVVSTRNGWANEYFGTYATYCQQQNGPPSVPPWSAHGNAVVTPTCARVSASTYTWSHAATATLAAYEQLLSQRVAERHAAGG